MKITTRKINSHRIRITVKDGRTTWAAVYDFQRSPNEDGDADTMVLLNGHKIGPATSPFRVAGTTTYSFGDATLDLYPDESDLTDKQMDARSASWDRAENAIARAAVKFREEAEKPARKRKVAKKRPAAKRKTAARPRRKVTRRTKSRA